MTSDAFSAPNDGAYSQSARERARLSQSVAMAAVVLLVLSQWSCYVTALASLPTSIYAVYLARGIEDHERDEVVDAYLRSSLAMGVISAVLSGLYVAMLMFIVLIYGGAALIALTAAASGA